MNINDDLYCEPFCGGAAVFFAKEPARAEVLNDLNGELINFYKVVKTDFAELKKEISVTLHSRELHRRACVVCQNPDMFRPVKRAWALWFLANICYNNIIGSTFGIDKKGGVTRKLANKRRDFSEEFARRLENVRLESRDALSVIESCDTDASFFYVDPPYVGADQGHYKGYSNEDFAALLNLLSRIKGKFLLSSYPNDTLTEYVEKYGWVTKIFDMHCSASNREGNPRKCEVLTANYSLQQD